MRPWLALRTMPMYALLLALVFTSCKKDSSPEPPSGPKPGKRDYVWTVDTIAYPGSFQTTMRDIWASSPTNVYVVGHNDQPGPGTMFRYDGTRWSTTRFHAAEGGGVVGPVSLSAVYGTGPNDIYAVGQHIYQNPSPPPNFLDSSLIIHFDGTQWREVQLPWRGRQLIGVGSTSSTSLLAGGVNGISYDREGGSWRAVQSDTTFWFSDFAADESGTYAMAYFPRPGFWEKDFFLRWSGSTWVIADSFSLGLVSARFGIYALCNIAGTLYSAGLGVFRRNGSSWEKAFESYETVIGLYGTRKEHIFAVGTTSSVFHFNGTDWYRYAQLNVAWVLCTAVWCTEDEVFVVGSDGNRTFIYHGQ
jgi:hypothetical protein